MSIIYEADTSSSFTDNHSSEHDTSVLTTTEVCKDIIKSAKVEIGRDDKGKSEPGTPKSNPMAFTIDFGEGKNFDKQRLEQLAKQSQARHQRVQSMSASLTRPSPIAQKPPLSAKLPRKTQGYNSEGYFSSDQEDSILSGSVKLRQSPLAQNAEANVTSPVITRHPKSPINDSFHTRLKTSKSPIVDSIMSRSDILPSRQSLNLPLKQTNSSYIRDFHRSPSYNNISSSYQPYNPMTEIVDQSPEGFMLTDISSPELDILTPDNGLSTPEHKSPLFRKNRRASSEVSDILSKKLVPNSEPLYIDDDVDRLSNNSSTGTYTIEGDNYTEEQKARMSIDRTFGTKRLDDAIDTLKNHHERDPELIFDYPKVTKDLRRETLASPTSSDKTFEMPSKTAKDKNILEISCCYESPTDTDLAAQTSKQIKSTRNYLEKIKNRVRTITEKTFAKSPPKYHEPADVGSFTSVTTSGVLKSNNCMSPSTTGRRRCSLTTSEMDQTDYIHRLSRESSVPVSLPSKNLPLDLTQFESTPLRNAHIKVLKDDDDETSITAPGGNMVSKLSYLSLNRCKGDKTWIQEWADSVKKYNSNTLCEKEDLNSTFVLSDGNLPPPSPRYVSQGKYTITTPRSTLAASGIPTKIPNPVSLSIRSKQDMIPTQDTESYLVKTQTAITNLQAKLQSPRANNFFNISPQLTSSLISEKTVVSRLPVSQLSRSNSLNYRLRRKEASTDGSPLRSPGNYVITGSAVVPDSTRLLVNSASKSLDTDKRRICDSNMNSPSSDRGLLSYSSDDKTLSNRPHEKDAPVGYRKAHARHKSFDGRHVKEYFHSDVTNANPLVSLKTVLKNNALETQKLYTPRIIDQTRFHGDPKRKHQRVLSDNDKGVRRLPNPTNVAFGSSIKRSSSFNTVNKNNNFLDSGRLDLLSDESDDKSELLRFSRPALLARGKFDSSVCRSRTLTRSPKCPNTPEMPRKFGPELVRNSGRAVYNTRMSEPPMAREERQKPVNHQSRKISDTTRQSALNRLTKSRSSTREIQPNRNIDKGAKKPAQHRSSSALASGKELEFSNWKKRSSYDPAKAALEGKKRKQQLASTKMQAGIKDDTSSPSHSSPVHRSQSFHSTNLIDLDTLDYSSEDDEQLLSTLPMDHPMITSTHSDMADFRPKTATATTREYLRRQALANDVVLAKDYVTGFQVNQPSEKKRRDIDKRKTFIIDDAAPAKENIDFLKHRGKQKDTEPAIDKRKTFILDSDTNSTTNGSSPRNSSIFSHEKHSLTTGTSDTEGESGTESAPVVLRNTAKKTTPTQPNKRHSGDYSMSSSMTSIGKEQKRGSIQPRYLDISKYKSESSPKTFLRKDTSKTYVGVLNHVDRGAVSKVSAQQYELEQKKQELEKWKRRASYDPRKAAASGKVPKTPAKTASSVLRSQSFNGPVLMSTSLRYVAPVQIAESYDQSSDNDF